MNSFLSNSTFSLLSRQNVFFNVTWENEDSKFSTVKFEKNELQREQRDDLSFYVPAVRNLDVLAKFNTSFNFKEKGSFCLARLNGATPPVWIFNAFTIYSAKLDLSTLFAVFSIYFDLGRSSFSVVFEKVGNKSGFRTIFGHMCPTLLNQLPEFVIKAFNVLGSNA